MPGSTLERIVKSGILNDLTRARRYCVRNEIPIQKVFILLFFAFDASIVRRHHTVYFFLVFPCDLIECFESFYLVHFGTALAHERITDDQIENIPNFWGCRCPLHIVRRKYYTIAYKCRVDAAVINCFIIARQLVVVVVGVALLSQGNLLAEFMCILSQSISFDDWKHVTFRFSDGRIHYAPLYADQLHRAVQKSPLCKSEWFSSVLLLFAFCFWKVSHQLPGIWKMVQWMLLFNCLQCVLLSFVSLARPACEHVSFNQPIWSNRPCDPQSTEQSHEISLDSDSPFISHQRPDAHCTTNKDNQFDYGDARCSIWANAL